MWDKKKFPFETRVFLLIFYGCEVWGCSISRESWRKIEQFQKQFITYNLKIKNNMLYLILLIEVDLSFIESIVMTRYLMYKHKINNMGNESIPKIALNSSQNQLCVKRCWCKDTMAWSSQWGIIENDILENIDNFNKIITSKFKKNFLCEENLTVERKSRYHKEVINNNLEDQNYLSVVTSS